MIMVIPTEVYKQQKKENTAICKLRITNYANLMKKSIDTENYINAIENLFKIYEEVATHLTEADVKYNQIFSQNLTKLSIFIQQLNTPTPKARAYKTYYKNRIIDIMSKYKESDDTKIEIDNQLLKYLTKYLYLVTIYFIDNVYLWKN